MSKIEIGKDGNAYFAYRKDTFINIQESICGWGDTADLATFDLSIQESLHETKNAILTCENYFTPEMNVKYMSASQFKSFLKCEAMAVAELNGQFERESTVSLLVGSYVDAHFEQTLDIFKAQNPQIFTQKGELKSEYKKAEYIIQRLERDKMFMSHMAGEKQVIMTGEIMGVPFKIRMDSYHKGKCIDDLKIMKDFSPMWQAGDRVSFIEAWGYDIQGAIYQEIESQNSTSHKKLPFFIPAATKENEPDLAVISIDQDRLDYCMNDIIKPNLPRFAHLKKGMGEPHRCETCDYCKSTKVLTRVVSYDEFE